MRIAEVFEKLNKINDGNRTLIESIAIPEVGSALKDWSKHVDNGILIGGCAYSFYGRPRATSDLDFLFLSDTEIPTSVPGFKKIRDHAFRHISTHVEIEVLSSNFLNISQDLVSKVIDTSVTSNGVKVASPSGIVALKLQRLSYQDMSDIENLHKLGNVDLSGWPLSDLDFENYNKIINKTI